MPQGGRKAPFSGKAKKQQLQAKKDRKNAEGEKGINILQLTTFYSYEWINTIT